jgi:acetyl esterase
VVWNVTPEIHNADSITPLAVHCKATGASKSGLNRYHITMKSPTFDAEITQFINRYLEVSGLSTATSVAQQRIDYESMVRQFTYPHPAGIRTEDSELPGRHGDIPLRHYYHGPGDDSALILFLHGGGFILGSLDSHDDICAELCAATGFNLVSVDYRLSPEYLHPIHLDDVEDAFLGLGHKNTILTGASAGGTLAAALSHRLKSGSVRAAGQVLIYPGLGGDRYTLDSYRDNAEAPLLSTRDIYYYRGTRCGNGVLPVDDAEFYPLAASEYRGTPPTIAFSADVDPLRDDARSYVAKLQDDDVSASWINEPGLVHDYLRARHISRVAGAAFARICSAITRLAS